MFARFAKHKHSIYNNDLKMNLTRFKKSFVFRDRDYFVSESNHWDRYKNEKIIIETQKNKLSLLTLNEEKTNQMKEFILYPQLGMIPIGVYSLITTDLYSFFISLASFLTLKKFEISNYVCNKYEFTTKDKMNFENNNEILKLEEIENFDNNKKIQEIIQKEL